MLAAIDKNRREKAIGTEGQGKADKPSAVIRQWQRNGMKCPGCGEEIAESSEYCGSCGGKINGSTVDYSQKRKRASDAFETNSLEPGVSEPLSEIEERWLGVMSLRFVLWFFGAPSLGVLFLFVGFVEDRTDLLFVGAFFLALSALMIALAVRYGLFKEEAGSRGEAWQRRNAPRFFRRL